MSSCPPLYQLLQTPEKPSRLHRRAQNGRLVISRVFRAIIGMQAVSYNQLLSESDLLNCGWLVVEGIPHWKDGFGLCLGVAKSDFNCLFNVLKTMSFYFHLIKTVKLSFKYMEFATNCHWFCSLSVLFTSNSSPNAQLTIKHYLFLLRSRTTKKKIDRGLACVCDRYSFTLLSMLNADAFQGTLFFLSVTL